MASYQRLFLACAVALLSISRIGVVEAQGAQADYAQSRPQGDYLGSVLCRLETGRLMNVQYSTFLDTYIEVDPVVSFNGDPIFDDDYTQENPIVQVRVCWCAQYYGRDPEFCPIEYDACKVEGFEGPITCFEDDQGGSFMRSFWFICLLWYVALAYSLAFTDQGLAARAFIKRKLCLKCCTNQTTERDFLLHEIDTMIERDPDRATWILRSAFLRQREQQQRTQQGGWIIWRNGRNPLAATEGAEPGTNNDEAPTNDDNNADNSLSEWQQIVELKVKKYDGSGTNDVTEGLSNESEEASENNIEVQATSTSASTFSISSASQFLSNALSLNIETADENNTDDNQSEHDGVCCAICLSPIEIGDRIGDIPCGHIYCVDCLKAWIQKKNHCPLCMRSGLATPRSTTSTTEESSHEGGPEGRVSSPLGSISPSSSTGGLIVSMPATLP